MNFGNLTTADHKVLSEAYPCKNKTSQETQRSLQKFLEPERKPKVIYTDNSLEFGKACEDLSWNHCTSTPHRSETNGIAERAVRRVKEGTSVVLLQSGLNESWWADSAKSTSPTTENWLRKLYKYSMNINTSIEDKNLTNHINNKYMDMNTRKMHNL